MRLVAKVGPLDCGRCSGARPVASSPLLTLDHRLHGKFNGRAPSITRRMIHGGTPVPALPPGACFGPAGASPSDGQMPSYPQVKVEHTDLGGSFVKPQSARDAEVALELCPQRGPVLSVSLKPRPVSCLRGPGFPAAASPERRSSGSSRAQHGAARPRSKPGHASCLVICLSACLLACLPCSCCWRWRHRWRCTALGCTRGSLGSSSYGSSRTPGTRVS